MEAKELRIGNYVWDDYGGNMIIHQISNDLVDCKKENHLPSGRYDLGSIKPIVIDGNWLLKFGFEKQSNNSWQLDTKYGFSIWGRIDHGFWLFIESDDCGNSIKHVHQLQNLYFALTGKELILKP